MGKQPVICSDAGGKINFHSLGFVGYEVTEKGADRGVEKGCEVDAVSEAAVFRVYFQIVNAGVAFFHEAVVVELPVLVAVCAVPLAFLVMIFVFEAYGDAIAGKGPEFLFQLVVEFLFPIAGEEFDDLVPTVEKFVAVAPFGIGGICE